MNIALLKKVKAHILAHPNRFIMHSWILTPEILHGKNTFPTDLGVNDGTYNEAESRIPFDQCGTAACIAGWTCLIASHGEDKDRTSIQENAAAWLDINEYDIETLFFVDGWPRKFRDSYYGATSQQERAQIAAERIDQFIASKKKRGMTWEK